MGLNTNAVASYRSSVDVVVADAVDVIVEVAIPGLGEGPKRT